MNNPASLYTHVMMRTPGGPRRYRRVPRHVYYPDEQPGTIAWEHLTCQCRECRHVGR